MRHHVRVQHEQPAAGGFKPSVLFELAESDQPLRALDRGRQHDDGMEPDSTRGNKHTGQRGVWQATNGG